MWCSLNAIVLVQILAKVIVIDGSSSDIDINIDDILSAQLMPVSWLVHNDDHEHRHFNRRDGGGPSEDTMMMMMRSNDDDGQRTDRNESIAERVNGSFGSALSTMGFHR